MEKFDFRKISPDLRNLLEKISDLAEEEGQTVYLVGGFVRDYMLNKQVDDIDIAVEGDGIRLAKQFKKKFGGTRVVSYGRFGTAMLNHGKYKVEFASTREEYYEESSRKPKVVKADIFSDLSRRDFTVNAMAVSLNKDDMGKLLDPFDGRGDLQRKLIRTPLSPEITYFDDPLRMLRAVRFASRFGFDIDGASYEAISAQLPRLEIVSQERITEELSKMLMHEKPSVALHLLQQTGLLNYVLPDIAALREEYTADGVSLFEVTLRLIDKLAEAGETDVYLRYAALFLFVGERRYDNILNLGRKMKFPGKKVKEIALFVKYVPRIEAMIAEGENPEFELREMFMETGKLAGSIIKLAKTLAVILNGEIPDKFIKGFEATAEKIKSEEDWEDFSLALTGEEIMEILGITEGIAVGKAVHKLKEAVIRGEIRNRPGECEQYLLKLYK